VGGSRGDPPYRIRTERLLIRCWDPHDAPLLKEAIDSSLDHLRPWAHWAHDEPRPLEEKVQLLRGFRGRFDLGQDFAYGIFAPDESEVLGGTGLHTCAGEDAFEIGYWIRANRIGKGLALEAASALTRVAFAMCGVDRVEIHVEPANEVSCGIPRRLGFAEDGRLRRRLPAPTGEARRDAILFTMLPEEFTVSELVDFPLEAYDRFPRPIGTSTMKPSKSRHAGKWADFRRRNRGGRTRTCNPRFWRPVLCQLSYAPRGCRPNCIGGRWALWRPPAKRS
jgi:RimJ/RimL family protein N-acetyltransferase